MNPPTSMRIILTVLVLAVAAGAAACAAGNAAGPSNPTTNFSAASPEVLAVVAETSFLADIAQNVAGDRAKVESLVPLGTDPHSFDPTPRDAAMVARARALVINSPGFEPPVDRLFAGAGRKDLTVVDASEGLAGENTDPHFWLDPIDVITYVENIRAGLTAIDPQGADEYASNAAAYDKQLRELDSWIQERVATVPVSRRLLVTNHESLGHFADRYGFTVVGTVFPSTDTEGAPSASALGTLIDDIRATGAPAIFLETGSNPDLAAQVARETGVKVVTDLYTHSLAPDAPTYLEMMRWNVDHIVEALR
jgi:ABC-type Zn uptake system ZnuABC Zn-binding protein ZnuA